MTTTSGPAPTQTPPARAERRDLPIRGMTCASCVRHVERALRRVDGVQEANVNLVTQRATVLFDPGATSVRALAEAVEEAGYEVPGALAPDETDSAGPASSPTAAEAEASSEASLSLKSDASTGEASTGEASTGEASTGEGSKSEGSASQASSRGASSKDGASQREASSPSAVASTPRRVNRAKATSSARSTAETLREAEAREQRTLRRDLLLAAAFTAPLLVIAMSHGAIPFLDGALGRWLQLGLATPVVFGPGRRFFHLAWLALRRRSADMNVLIALGAGAAYLYSALGVLAPSLFPHAEHGHTPHLYFEAAAAILTFVLLGRLLEGRSRAHLGDAVRGLVALQPRTARRLRGDTEEAVPVEALVPGDLVLVRPGERLPADGQIVRGSSGIDESMLTGESLPVDKAEGDPVSAGTLNTSGAITLRVTTTGEGTALARIARAVEDAQGSKAPIARLADVVSGYFVPTVVGIALLSFGAWLWLTPGPDALATAIERAVAVLVIACPCALGLATPAAVAVGTGRGAELGVLVKGGAALEALSRVDLVLVDKTGTLTTGKPALTHVIDRSGLGEDALLALVGSAERGSEHPIAHALVEGARARGATLDTPDVLRAEAGHGVEARIGDRTLRVGTRAFLAAAGIDPEPLEPDASRLAEQGSTPSFVAIDGRLAGLVAVADRPADGAREAIAELTHLGVDLAVLTGDRQATARAIARELGVTEVHAELRPEDKARIITDARRDGRRVAMVGDGVNDAPALASADVGIAIGTGADIALDAADVALLHGGIRGVPTSVRLARKTLGTIRQNLFFAFVYNVIGIPIAAGVFFPWTGWLLSPVIASAAMSLSSVSVLLSSLRLRRFQG
ncbi:heavy metal translocating P-type ATPase [Chondromyces crocatus]|uniref:P-type Cu(+) transporter n=1 Tax=Chondromyces crocatus TaxID=52 RepID=A0A0K1EI22_CHOCO|nr:heavy metal translocating P-type ATPase [Chondromyces crocatus]AKT40332.1 copper-translocating P-type ATPase [Chondromyces crocatus]